MGKPNYEMKKAFCPNCRTFFFPDMLRIKESQYICPKCGSKAIVEKREKDASTRSSESKNKEHNTDRDIEIGSIIWVSQKELREYLVIDITENSVLCLRVVDKEKSAGIYVQKAYANKVVVLERAETIARRKSNA